MEVEKVCPFCEEVFSSKEIKAHIGISHLGIESVDHKTEDKVENLPDKKRKRSEDLQQNENKKAKTTLSGEENGTTEKVFSCKLCDKTYTKKRYLQSHIEGIHQTSSDLHCSECNVSFSKYSNLERHVKSVHLGKTFDCDQCSKKFKTKFALNSHTKRIHQQFVEKHPIVDEMHQKASEQVCNMSLSNDDNLESNVKSVRLGKPFDCDKCSKKFTTKFALNSHTKRIHQQFVEEKPIADDLDQTLSGQHCIKCDMNFSSKGNLERHVNTVHLGKSVFQCDQCNKRFTTKFALTEHTKGIHLKSSEFHCAKCDRAFSTRLSLRRHLKTNQHGNVQAVLGINPSLDKTEPIVLLERLSEETIKNFNVSKGSILSKSKTESEEDENGKDKNNQKNLIPNKPLDKDNITDLDIELNVTPDSKERVIKCNQCTSVFSHNEYKMDHIQNVHIGVPFQCDKCDKQYTVRRSLYAHKKVCKSKSEAGIQLNENLTEIVAAKTLEDVNPDLLIEEQDSDDQDKKEQIDSISFEQTYEDNFAAFYVETNIDEMNESQQVEEPTKEKQVKKSPQEQKTAIQENMFTCTNCHKSYKFKYTLNRHLQYECGKEKAFQCAKCKDDFPHKTNCVGHLKRIHNIVLDTMEQYVSEGLILLKSKAAIESIGDVESHDKNDQNDLELDDANITNPDTDLQDLQTERFLNEDHFVDDDQMPENDKPKIVLEHDTNSKMFQCGQCDKKYSQKQNLRNHIRGIHQKSSKQHCTKCGKKFPKSYNLRRHLRAVHFGYKYECGQCQKQLSSAFALKKHVTKIHMKTLKSNPDSFDEELCECCGEMFKSKEALKTHMDAYNELEQNEDTDLPDLNPELCESCGQMFETKEALESHIQNEHNKSKECYLESELCESCGDIFNSLEALNDHKKSNHSKVQRRRLSIRLDRLSAKTINQYLSSKKETVSDPGWCLKCEKGFGTRANLKQHDKIVHQKIKFKCTNCPKVLSTKQNLRFHMNTKHRGAYVQCQKCHKKFIRQTDLNAHESLVHQKIKVKCDRCPRLFSSVKERRSHILKVHTVHNCQQCSKKFLSQTRLDSHIRFVHEPNSILTENES